MISKKTTYGLKAVIYLAKKSDSNPVLITDLAREEGIPKKFLEAILLELRKEGILESKKGKGGGYFLGRLPDEITIGQVIKVLDGPLGESSFSNKTDEDNEIKAIMKEVRDAMSNILDRTTLADVIERTRSGKNVLNYMI